MILTWAASDAGLSTHLLLCGEVVPKLPHQVLLLGAQLLGRRVAHNNLGSHMQRSSVISNNYGGYLCNICVTGLSEPTASLVTHVQLVTCCSVGLQVVIRGSAPEATSQFVMLALNQVFLQWEHKSAESHITYSKCIRCIFKSHFLSLDFINKDFISLTIPICGSGTFTMSQLVRMGESSSPSCVDTKRNTLICAKMYLALHFLKRNWPFHNTLCCTLCRLLWREETPPWGTWS